MGYYTTVEMALQVKRQKLAKFESAIAQLKAGPEDKGNKWFDRYDDLGIGPGGYLQLQENRRKLCDADKLAAFLAPYVEQGGIWCWGEEPGDISRIVFDGRGNFEMQQGRVVYGGRLKLAGDGVAADPD
jgi:hypothetical protein